LGIHQILFFQNLPASTLHVTGADHFLQAIFRASRSNHCNGSGVLHRKELLLEHVLLRLLQWTTEFICRDLFFLRFSLVLGRQ